MIDSIKAGSAVLGMTLVQTWRNLDEPRIHRLQLAMSNTIDSCVSNAELSAQGPKQLGKKIAAHMATEFSSNDASVSVLMGVMDDTHEQLWLTATEGPPLSNLP